MKLTTKDHTIFIANWVASNSAILPINAWALGLKTSGKSPWISDGTAPSNWKREAKKIQSNGEIIRAFRGECDIFEAGLILITHEINGAITDIEPFIRSRLLPGYDPAFTTKYGLPFDVGGLNQPAQVMPNPPVFAGSNPSIRFTWS